MGYRQMTVVINREHEVHYNKKRIYRLMQMLHLKSVTRVKKYTYIPSTPQITADNILNRDFHADKPNEKWLTDVTEFKYYVGPVIKKLYLSAVLDLYDRRIVAFKIGDSNNNELVFSTFDEAVKLNPDAHPIFHSDRGFQYTNKIFHQKLVDAGMIQSMSRVGRCIDNGPMEGWWGILKSEMYYLRKFTDRESLIAAIEEYIKYFIQGKDETTRVSMVLAFRHEGPAAYEVVRLVKDGYETIGVSRNEIADDLAITEVETIEIDEPVTPSTEVLTEKPKVTGPKLNVIGKIDLEQFKKYERSPKKNDKR